MVHTKKLGHSIMTISPLQSIFLVPETKDRPAIVFYKARTLPSFKFLEDYKIFVSLMQMDQDDKERK